MPFLRQRRYDFIPPAAVPEKPFLKFSTLNTRDAETDLKDDELTVAKNVRFGSASGFSKRKGTQRKGEQIAANSKILGLHSYVNKANTAELLATCSTDIWRYTDSNTPATIATSTNAQGVGYSKDRHVFMTTAHTDSTNGLPFCAVLYQSGSAITLEWEDTPYGTWSNSTISVDTSTQIGFSGYMDSSDNIHVAFMSDANTVKYVKLTYGAGPTWSVGSKITVKGSGASDSASMPSITRQSGGRLHVAYRYYDGANYQVKAQYSDDSGATWTGETGLSTASTNTRHMPQLMLVSDFPLCFYQVGEASATSFYYRTWTGTWSAQSTVGSVTSSTDNAFSAVVTGTSLWANVANGTGNTGMSITTFGTAAGAQRRLFDVVNDGSNDNDIEYFNTINGSTDISATRISNDSSNNLYPTAAESVSTSATFVPVVWIEGTGSPYNIKINSNAHWVALGYTSGLTAGLPMCSTYFPSTSAGGTDKMYFTNGTDKVALWDGSSVSLANASYPKPKWIVHYENRLWMGNYASTQNRVAYTNLGADGTGGALPAGNIIDFPEQTLWGHVYYTKLLVFSRAAIYVVENFDYSGSAVGPESQRIRKMPNSFGTLSGLTVQQIGYWVYFQSPDGHIRRTNGQYVELVSSKIEGTIEDLSSGGFTNSAGGKLGNYYYCSVTGNASAQNNTWLVLDTTQAPQDGWSIDTGKTTSCFVTHPDSNGAPQLFYGESTTTDGSVYRAEIGDSDNGDAIDMDIQSGIIIYGDLFSRKEVRDIVVVAEAAGDYDLTVGYSLLSNLNSFTNASVNLNAGAPVWGAFVWGDFTWGGKSHIQEVVHIWQRDRGFKYRFRNNAADQPVTVYSYATTQQRIHDTP